MYQSRKISYLFAIILFGGALPFTTYALIKGFQNGINIDAFAGIPAILIHIGALVLFIYLFTRDPYKQIHDLQKTNPSLAQQMITELDNVIDLCKNIKRSQSFYYFSGRTHILVVPIGQVKRIRCYTGYSKSVGHYKAIEVESDYGKVKPVFVSVVSLDDTAPDQALLQICRENNIQLEK